MRYRRASFSCGERVVENSFVTFELIAKKSASFIKYEYFLENEVSLIYNMLCVKLIRIMYIELF